MRIFLVYKTGGDYTKNHVSRLVKQIRQFHPTAEISILTDAVHEVSSMGDWTYRLVNDWPGWWSKMEVFKFRGPILFMDLDTTIVGPLDELWEAAQQNPLVMCRDFYFPTQLQSSLMAWNGGLRELYDSFSNVASHMMRVMKKGSDQTYVEMLAPQMGIQVAKWQDIVPDRVYSYKVHVRGGTVPPSASVICFHGKPRPWDIDELHK